MASLVTALRHPREAKPMVRSAHRILTTTGLAAVFLVGFHGFGARAPPSSLAGEPADVAFVVSLGKGRCDSPLRLHAGDEVGGVVYEPSPGGRPADPDEEDSPDAEEKVKMSNEERTIAGEYDRVAKIAKHLKKIKGKFKYIGPKPFDKHQFTKVIVMVTLETKQAANAKIFAQVVEELRRVTGKHPQALFSRKNDIVTGTRVGDRIGAQSVLTGKDMTDFLERFNTLTLPRVRDFEGLIPNSFNKLGDFRMSIPSQEPFFELDELIDERELSHEFKVRINNNCMTQPDALALMKAYGFPFSEPRVREGKQKIPEWKRLMEAKGLGKTAANKAKRR